MRKFVGSEYGSLDAFALSEGEIPQPAQGEVRLTLFRGSTNCAGLTTESSRARRRTQGGLTTPFLFDNPAISIDDSAPDRRATAHRQVAQARIHPSLSTWYRAILEYS